MKHLFKVLIACILLTVFSLGTFAQSIGVFNKKQDIGKIKSPGNSSYDEEQQTYQITGTTSLVMNDDNVCHFLSRKIKGDFIIRAHVQIINKNSTGIFKVGLMAQNSNDSNSPFVSAVVDKKQMATLDFRKGYGKSNFSLMSSDQEEINVIQLERKGNQFTMSSALFGETFSTINLDVALNDEVHIGLFASSYDQTKTVNVKFSNLRIISPAPADLKVYQEYIGSNLEIMNIETGHRKIVHQYARSFQAPNWTVDGKSLIYNQEGLLYNFDIESESAKVIDTGFAKHNNNDHLISFDGKMLAISDHSKHSDRKSQIYTLPLSGGTPELITQNAPSYLHGWSPDGKKLVYTGQRNNEYDIYQIDINTKIETRLTNAIGLDDGPEYSPDGKFIYFNSSRYKIMQLFRMSPDGRNEEQITWDVYNDWFPHISPDGKWIVFLSYKPEVKADAHPFYQQVYLRLMPTDGSSKPKVIAYLYGGQGTINVPSWSPDSKRIAFVSNTKMD